MEIEFSQIKRENIFCMDFDPFVENNKLNFSNKKVIVVYGPNGIGKTSLARVFQGEDNTLCQFSWNNNNYKNVDETIFLVIEDQNRRNIIKGDPSEFILGDDIEKEIQLKNQILIDFDIVFNSRLIPSLAKDFKISTVKSSLLSYFKFNPLRNFIVDLVNRQSKGSKINQEEFLRAITNLEKKGENPAINKQVEFIINDCTKPSPIISQILSIKEKQIAKEPKVEQIEENDEAIRILEKFPNSQQCIICDSPIEREVLLNRKKDNKKFLLESLDDVSKQLLTQINSEIDPQNDPLSIREGIINSIKDGNTFYINKVIENIQNGIDEIENRIINLFYRCLDQTNLVENFTTYNTLLANKPEFSEEEIIFIRDFINNCLEREISIRRDNDKNLVLFLGESPLLNTSRDDLHLSNGEQNFISIAFELLKAKKKRAEIIVLDDPISSFDSIFKNKIVYAIKKFLDQKFVILLTHSTELIHLLEHQQNNCFNLYMLNNTTDENNGFIEINENERKILIYIDELIQLLGKGVNGTIKNEKEYVISLIPFMRGFAHIVNNKNAINKLTYLMHGYTNRKINITTIYQKLFRAKPLQARYLISSQDILDINIDNETEIVDITQYPLLTRTLYHSLVYLYLRLSVEKVLVTNYKVNTRRFQMLNQIINFAFPANSKEHIEKRAFLMSRKTLLNEFNHFEVDFNIFQPSIDIKDSSLIKEKNEIIKFIANEMKTKRKRKVV